MAYLIGHKFCMHDYFSIMQTQTSSSLLQQMRQTQSVQLIVVNVVMTATT